MWRRGRVCARVACDAAVRLSPVRLQYGGTALMLASQENHVEAARLLLERGADPNAKDYVSVPLSRL